MKKYLLPVFAASAVLSAGSADAQFTDINTPFNDVLGTMPHFGYVNVQHMSAPRIDIAEMKDKIEVKAELPGLTVDDVQLSCENNILTLSGDKKSTVEEKNKDYYLKEISSGSFSRSVRLPPNINESKIDAVFKNGILTISIPKTEQNEDTLHKIPIKTEE